MMVAPKPMNESMRQASVERLQLLGIPEEESFDRVTRLAARLVNVPAAAFSIIDGDRQHLRATIGLGDLSETSRDVSFCAHVVANNQALVVEDTMLDPRFCDNPLVTSGFMQRFYAGVPVRSPDMHTIGALCVIDSKPHKISGEELNTLTDLASIIERELVLRSLVRTDPLTGLYNRRHYELEIDREWRRAMRAHSSVAAMMIDVDCFKDFNDTYGHQKGDIALKRVAEILALRFRRPGDLLIRYGGEEFLVLLPDTSDSIAAALAEDLRKSVMELDLTHAYSPHKVLTVSVGVALAKTEAELRAGPQKLVRHADEALYAAKGSGRNRVIQYNLDRPDRFGPENPSNAKDKLVGEANKN